MILLDSISECNIYEPISRYGSSPFAIRFVRVKLLLEISIDPRSTDRSSENTKFARRAHALS